MKIFFTLMAMLLIIILLGLSWWYVGGLHLDYLKENGINKATEICDENSEIKYEGYQRQIFGGFGGRVWYLCKLDGISVDFYVSRRINNPELQVYNIKQIFTIPTKIEISN